MDIYLIGLIALYSFICGGLSAKVAYEKGFDDGIWFLLGLLFGVLGLIAAAGLPLKRKNEKIV